MDNRRYNPLLQIVLNSFNRLFCALTMDDLRKFSAIEKRIDVVLKFKWVSLEIFDSGWFQRFAEKLRKIRL